MWLSFRSAPTYVGSEGFKQCGIERVEFVGAIQCESRNALRISAQDQIAICIRLNTHCILAFKNGDTAGSVMLRAQAVNHSETEGTSSIRPIP